MRSSQRIRQVLSRYQRKPNPQQGILGNEIGEISVPNRVDFVYVRVAGLGTISVYNKRVPLILDLPVDVGYDPLEPKNFQVLNIHRYPQGGGRGLVDVATILHGKTHNWAGIDPVYIEKRQLMPLRPTPLGGMQLYVTREVTYYDDKAVIVTGQQLDLTPYIPATGSLMVLIYKDTDEIVKVQTGGVLRDIFSLTLADAPQAYPGTVPIALIRLYGGQTGIAEGYNDTDLIDVRQLFSPIDLTGTGGVGGGHVIQKDGISQTQRTNLNFIGVDITDDPGGDATKITLTGTSSSSNDSVTPFWYVDGLVIYTTGNYGQNYIVPFDGYFNKVWMHEENLGVTGSTICDIHRNGVTVFTDQDNRPVLVYDDADKVVSAVPDLNSLVAGDILSFYIDQNATECRNLTCVPEIVRVLPGVQSIRPQTAYFTVDGEIETTTGKLRIYNRTGHTRIITGVYLSVGTPPTGAAVIVDIHMDGTTIHTTQSNRAQIAATANTGQTTTIEVSAWPNGSYLTMDIDQVGSTNPGNDLVVGIVSE